MPRPASHSAAGQQAGGAAGAGSESRGLGAGHHVLDSTTQRDRTLPAQFGQQACARDKQRGGVGTYAVQIAAALGAEVTGVCGTRNVELVHSIGAAHVIDYTTEDFTGGGPGTT